MSSEKAFSRTFMTKAPINHAVRLEERMQEGVPDILAILPSGKTAFIELKQSDYWASNPSDYGLSQSQAVFLWRWWMEGGSSWVLCRIGNEYILLRGLDARKMKKDGLETTAFLRFPVRDRNSLAQIVGVMERNQ